jgi:serine/threonine protein kinase
MVHRDVKSANILLGGFKTNRFDDVSVAKLADFGTVRADDSNKEGVLRTSMATHSWTTRVVGTGPYMPQEYIASGHVSEKTGAFALGIVFIELLISGALKHTHAVPCALQARSPDMELQYAVCTEARCLRSSPPPPCAPPCAPPNSRENKLKATYICQIATK